MKGFVRFLLTITLLASATTGCFTPPDYSPVPEIAFNSMDKFEVIEPFSKAKQDSVIITIEFKDGDGDLGESPANRDDPRYGEWGNYELKTLRRTTGNQYVEFPLPGNNKLFFPILKPDGKKGPIEGRLDYSHYFPHSNNSRPTTVKFQIRVRDRALNVSNVIESDTISVHLLQ